MIIDQLPVCGVSSEILKADSMQNIDVLVCSRQYDSKYKAARGYGDIAHGVRVIELLQKNLTDRKIVFAIEYSGDSAEEKRIEKLASINSISYLLIGRNNQATDIEKRKILQKWIQQAKCIIHGPSKLIEEVKLAPKELKHKIMLFDEYEINTNFLQKKEEYFDISLYSIGFIYHMLHLPTHENLSIKFDNTQLAELFYPLIASKQLSTNSINNNPIYFAYAGIGTKRFITGMLRNLLLFEKNQSRDIYLISTLSWDKLDFWYEQENIPYVYINKKLSATECYNNFLKREKHILGEDTSATVFYANKAGEQCFKVYPPNVTTTPTKNIYFINPASLTNNDFIMINIISSFIYASGDISCSDTLSFNKIPFIEPDKKHSIYTGLLGSLEIFCKEKPEYKNFSSIWNFIARNFSCTFYGYYSDIEGLVKTISSSTWLDFQRDFTAYLRSINIMDESILNYVTHHINNLETNNNESLDH